MKSHVFSGFVGLYWISLSSIIVCSYAGEGKKPLTFLDTLNKGREVSITPVDYGIADTAAPTLDPLQNETAAASVQAPPESALLPVKAEPKKPAGVVASRFRIQVLASTLQDRVKAEKNTLGVKTKLPVSISFEAPYYKLFAGDFAQRDEAEDYLARLKNMGYNDAWIVRTAVK